MENLEDKIKKFLEIGDGYGSGSGYGSGDGYGDGDGYGSGYGYGSGSGDGIRSYKGQEVYMIDGVQTLINHVSGALAKGFILENDGDLDAFATKCVAFLRSIGIMDSNQI